MQSTAEVLASDSAIVGAAGFLSCELSEVWPRSASVSNAFAALHLCRASGDVSASQADAEITIYTNATVSAAAAAAAVKTRSKRM